MNADVWRHCVDCVIPDSSSPSDLRSSAFVRGSNFSSLSCPSWFDLFRFAEPVGQDGFGGGQGEGDEGQVLPEFGADAFLGEGVGEAGAAGPLGDVGDLAEVVDLLVGELVETGFVGVGLGGEDEVDGLVAAD